MDEFTITKHIAHHGKDSVIVIPAALKSRIPAGSLAQITIRLIETPIEATKDNSSEASQ